HALVEDVEGTLPQTPVAELFAVADDAAVDLVDLLETTVDHQGAEDLAADAAGAVGHHRFVLQIVILAGFDLLDEVVGGVNVVHHGVSEVADLGLHVVAAIEEDHLVTAFLDELVYLLRFEVDTAADDAVLIHLDLIRCPECHDLIADLDGQFGEG